MKTRALMLAALLCLPAGVLAQTPANAGAHAASHTATPAVPAALRPVLYRALARDAGPAYAIQPGGCAALAHQKLRACFAAGGVRFSAADAKPLALHLAAWGRGSALHPVTAVKPVVAGNRVRYAHGVLTEWWRVLPLGFEQGFTIAKRPAGEGELTLALASGGKPMVKDGTVRIGTLRYGKLVVTDAAGHVVPSSLSAKNDQILIAVNDAHAAYPLSVDPLVWLEQKVSASDGTTSALFGYSVAVSGTTALVGAPNATVGGNNGQGAAYVFDESGGTWTQTAKLTASDGATYDAFGTSVALDGTTALVGALNATVGSNSDQGAAYVFDESGGTWTQTAKLTANDGAAGDAFGNAVALTGATALVGTPYATVGGNDYQGAAYVFDESGGTWTQTAKLTANDGQLDDNFGYAVALSGTTALVGSIYAAVGGIYPGAAYVFDDSGGTWTQTAKLASADGADGDSFGWAVALDGTTALVGTPYATAGGNANQGAAYVFDDSGGTWTQTQKLTAADGESGDWFGWAVALDGTTALVGASYANVGGKYHQGVAYLFDDSGGTWAQTQKLTASDGAAYDEFGTSVALAGTTALVGAPTATVGSNGEQGAAYFEGSADLSLALDAPAQVAQDTDYFAYVYATNNSSVASPAVSVTVAAPAAASLIAAGASQGSCTVTSSLVDCALGPLGANGGTAQINVLLKAGAANATIHNSAHVVGAAPALSATAPTLVTFAVCPEGYAHEDDGSLTDGHFFYTPFFDAGAGREDVILYGATGLTLSAIVRSGNRFTIYHLFNRELHHNEPAGTYRWVVHAATGGGAYTLCYNYPAPN